MVSESDVRALMCVLRAIDDYELKRMPLRMLVATIEVALAGLDAVDEQRCRELRQEWGVLEEVHSVGVVAQDEMGEEAPRLIRAACGRLRALIGEVLAGSSDT